MKKINKKGFTLIELIAVVAIIAIISVIATPNVINMIDNGKKETFLANAKEMVSKAKYKYKIEKYEDLFISNGLGCGEITASDLGFSEDSDPDGNIYSLTESKVKVCLEVIDFEQEVVYYVTTVSYEEGGTVLGRGISDNGVKGSYVSEINLDTSKVVDLTN